MATRVLLVSVFSRPHCALFVYFFVLQQFKAARELEWQIAQLRLHWNILETQPLSQVLEQQLSPQCTT